MFVSKSALELFSIARDYTTDVREKSAALEAENRLLKDRLASLQANFDWLTTRVNSLEVERGQLLEKAYGVKTAVPEIARANVPNQFPFNTSLFEDMGDTAAKREGLPIFQS